MCLASSDVLSKDWGKEIGDRNVIRKLVKFSVNWTSLNMYAIRQAHTEKTDFETLISCGALLKLPNIAIWNGLCSNW